MKLREAKAYGKIKRASEKQSGRGQTVKDGRGLWVRMKASMCEEVLVTENSTEWSGAKIIFFPATGTNLKANHGLVGSYALCKVCPNCRLLGELVSLGLLSWAQ